MSKLPNVGTSIFTVMAQLANKHNAINLAQGFPNFTVDERLTTIVSKIASQNIHQYFPMAGFPPLLEKITANIFNNYQRKVSPLTEMLITAGATQGIFTTIQALVNTDDEVIILDPSYDCYETPVLLVNAKPIRIPLNDDFTPNWEQIEKAFSNKTRMIIINNPHNPSGKIWKDDDFIALEKLLNKFPNVLVLSDEVYEYISYEKPHQSINQKESIREKAIIVSSFGKSLHITGWKIGYVIAPKHIMDEIKKVHQFLVFSVNSLSQVAISEYLDVVNTSDISLMYQQKRDYFRGLLQNTKLELLPCEGSYFQVASYKNISTENDIDFTKRLIVDYGVAAIPVSAFYENKIDNQLIRFCFAKDDTTLEEAAQKLSKF